MKKKNKKLTHTFRHLDGPWCDVDYKMLHACFDFLCDFVEKENGLLNLMYQYDYWRKLDSKECLLMGMSREQARERARTSKVYWDEARKLYKWWTTCFIPENEAGTWSILNKDQADFENKQLIRLINIRLTLWT
jgi:hypothetical protein